jgi:hypothetical protein
LASGPRAPTVIAAQARTCGSPSCKRTGSRGTAKRARPPRVRRALTAAARTSSSLSRIAATSSGTSIVFSAHSQPSASAAPLRMSGSGLLRAARTGDTASGPMAASACTSAFRTSGSLFRRAATRAGTEDRASHPSASNVSTASHRAAESLPVSCAVHSDSGLLA